MSTYTELVRLSWTSIQVTKALRSSVAERGIQAAALERPRQRLSEHQRPLRHPLVLYKGIPTPPNVPLLQALWSSLHGVWDILKSSWGGAGKSQGLLVVPGERIYVLLG